MHHHQWSKSRCSVRLARLDLSARVCGRIWSRKWSKRTEKKPTLHYKSIRKKFPKLARLHFIVERLMANIAVATKLEHPALSLYMLCVVLWTYEDVSAEKQCQVERALRGKALKNHTFRSVAVGHPLECPAIFEKDLKCQSFNFYIPRKLCELNDKNKQVEPQDFVSDGERFYIGFRIWERRGVESCKQLYEEFSAKQSHVATLYLDSIPTSVFCHMDNFGCGDGGWTPVMKIDGNKDKANKILILTWSCTVPHAPSQLDHHGVPFDGKVTEESDQ
ncbi:uncharacterized protein LOC141889519 isoform X2 [Acropora palmata]|uniref:uncharacterized protein LOC141889519 isoform X2 n=1 Tax=Acropora palmata TaxID=6131 RepID=UPI003DA165EB